MTFDFCVSDYAPGGISDTNFDLGHTERETYFKDNFTNIYKDYVKVHKWLRFSPSNVLRVIKLRLCSLM